MAKPAKIKGPKSKPSDERYSPPSLLDPIADTMGLPHYDPATPQHNPTNARRFTCLPEDGASTDWLELAEGGYTWLNSPFSAGNLKRFSKKVVLEASRGCEILQLTPVDPSTAWWAILLSGLPAVRAELFKRLRYNTPSDQAALKSGAMQPACIWYFGQRPGLFMHALSGRAHFVCPIGRAA